MSRVAHHLGRTRHVSQCCALDARDTPVTSQATATTLRADREARGVWEAVGRTRTSSRRLHPDLTGRS